MKPHLLLLSFSLLPSLVLARGGRGHGGGGGGGGGDGGSSSSSGDTTSNSLTNLSFREPIYTALFAICIVFAVLTALQALQAVANARRRTNQQPPSITLPEFSVGSIFPTFLILSTICLTTAYSMQAAFYGLMYNENRPPGVSVGFYIAWYIIGFLADIFLVSGILALITHRGKVLFNASKALCDAKMVVDAILFMTLLALSMGYVGVMTVGTTGEDFQMARRLYVAYISSLFVTVVDIAVSSVILYIHSKRTPINDHKVRALILVHCHHLTLVCFDR